MNVEKQLKEKLINILRINDLEVVNNSHLHAGHASSPNNGKSHFKVIIRDLNFSKLPKIKSHQIIYNALKDEMDTFIHALEIDISNV